MRLLVVEDNRNLVANLFEYFEARGHTLDAAPDGLTGLHLATTQHYDAVVLDWMLPRLDGREVLRRLRDEARSNVPVLMLTARDELPDKIAGFRGGADDYLTKPFDVEELLARLRVLQRRLRGAAVNVLEHGSLRLDPGSFSVLHDGRPVPLQRREFMLLQKLLAAPGQVLTRTQLEESLYGWEGSVESNALDVHVHNLRKKLYPEVIRTVRGIGYVADPPA